MGEFGATSVVANGYVYEIGGVANPNAVEFAAINPTNGTLGAWSSTTSLPTGESGATSVVANGYIYEIGGVADPNAVEFAAINPANGTLGAWTSTTPLPSLPVNLGKSGATSVVANGYIYEIGGVANPNAVEFAAINANGTLGAWTAPHRFQRENPELLRLSPTTTSMKSAASTTQLGCNTPRSMPRATWAVGKPRPYRS